MAGLQRNRCGAGRVVHYDCDRGIGPGGIGVHRGREVLDPGTPGAEQIERGSVGAKAKAEPPALVGVDGVERGLDHSAHLMEDDPGAGYGSRVRLQDPTFGAYRLGEEGDGKGGKDGKDGKDGKEQKECKARERMG